MDETTFEPGDRVMFNAHEYHGYGFHEHENFQHGEEYSVKEVVPGGLIFLNDDPDGVNPEHLTISKNDRRRRLEAEIAAARTSIAVAERELHELERPDPVESVLEGTTGKNVRHHTNMDWITVHAKDAIVPFSSHDTDLTEFLCRKVRYTQKLEVID